MGISISHLKRRMCPLRVVLCLIVLFSFAAWSQGPTGEIVGSIADQTGAVVPSATVVITNMATGVARSITSNASGVYDAPGLTPGTYSVRVTETGFASSLLSNIVVSVDQVTRQNISLQIGDVNQSVEVQAMATTLDTETTTIGTVIENRSIEDLPLNGRNYLQLGELVPSGTTYGPNELHRPGARRRRPLQFSVESVRTAL